MCPEEAQKYCDSVVVGEAEHVWQELLADAEKNQLKPKYQAEKTADLPWTDIFRISSRPQKGARLIVNSARYMRLTVRKSVIEASIR